IRLSGGEVLEHAPAGCPPGTTVSVRELFFNTPARLKFLKSPLAEGGQITRVVGHFALAYPGIGFTLLSDGKPVFQSSGSGDLLDVIARLYGPEVARGMLPAECNDGLQVRGYVSEPRVSRSSRGYLSLFVNGRWIQGRQLLHAIEEAYASLLMVGRHPLAVININLDPAQVDVNVHPSKAEVKFAAERLVYARVHQAVHGAVARYAPLTVIGRADPSGSAERQVPSAEDTETVWPTAGAAAVGPQWGPGFHGLEDLGGPRPALGTAPANAFQALPMLRVLGQLALTYIIAEGPGGMYLIDQHAAHERVRLDEIQRSRANDTGQAPDAQLLLQPLTVEVSPAQAAAAEAARPALSRLGLDLEPFGDRTYPLRSVPAALPLPAARETISAMLDELSAESASEGWDEAAEHSLACHTAVRAGQKLSAEEMDALIAQLERCWSPQACAH